MPSTAHAPQSLITPFAYLLYHQRDAVLDVLEGLALDGQSGLAVFLNKWCERPDARGLWQSRVNVLALTSVLACARPALAQVHVRGEMVIRPNAQRGEPRPPWPGARVC
jgi:hypothetical protein